MDTDSVLFFRYLFAPFRCSGIMLRALAAVSASGRRGALALASRLWRLVASLTLFLSYRHADAGIASTLLFVYPILVALIMALVSTASGCRCARCSASCWPPERHRSALPERRRRAAERERHAAGFRLVALLCALHRGCEPPALKDEHAHARHHFLRAAVRAGALRVPHGLLHIAGPADRWYLWGCVCWRLPSSPRPCRSSARREPSSTSVPRRPPSWGRWSR